MSAVFVVATGAVWLYIAYLFGHARGYSKHQRDDRAAYVRRRLRDIANREAYRG